MATGVGALRTAGPEPATGSWSLAPPHCSWVLNLKKDLVCGGPGKLAIRVPEQQDESSLGQTGPAPRGPEECPSGCTSSQARPWVARSRVCCPPGRAPGRGLLLPESSEPTPEPASLWAASSWVLMPECAAAGFPEDDVRQALTMSASWESGRIGIQNPVGGPCPLPGNVDVRLQQGVQSRAGSLACVQWFLWGLSIEDKLFPVSGHLHACIFTPL